MSSKQKRGFNEHESRRLERERQEEALDDALKNTFPASDPGLNRAAGAA